LHRQLRRPCTVEHKRVRRQANLAW
jgi:hypothetical protein